MRHRVYTIGYEGAEIGQFLGTLARCGIEQVIDIREVPVSRKRGFSKSTLESALSLNNIRYCHLKALGDPKPGRDAMRRGDYPAFVEIFSDHIITAGAQAALQQAVDLALAYPSVLLCFERSPNQCHRKIVAHHMAEKADFQVQNIGVNVTPPEKALPHGDHKALEDFF